MAASSDELSPQDKALGGMFFAAAFWLMHIDTSG